MPHMKSLSLKAFGIFLLLVLSYSPAFAAKSKAEAAFRQSLSICVGKSSRMERLVCYDAFARDLGLMPAEEANKQEKLLAKYGFWQAMNIKDESGLDTIYLKLPAISANETDDSFHPVLTLKCQLKKTDLYVDWREPLTDNGKLKAFPISYSMDGEPEKAENWTLSGDGIAIYAIDAAAVIRGLKKKSKFVVSVNPDIGQPVKAVFQLDGFDQILQVLIDRCYKDGQPSP